MKLVTRKVLRKKRIVPETPSQRNSAGVLTEMSGHKFPLCLCAFV